MSTAVSVVWMDRERAHLFHFSEEQMQRECVNATFHDHHTHAKENQDRESNQFYDEVARHLDPARKVLLLGPGVAKKHFLTRLENHHPRLAGRVVGCETVDHPTDPQIAAYAKKYFLI